VKNSNLKIFSIIHINDMFFTKKYKKNVKLRIIFKKHYEFIYTTNSYKCIGKRYCIQEKGLFFWLTLEHFHYLEDAKKRMTELLKQRQEEETIFYPENPKIKASGGELTLIDEKNK